MLELPGVKKTNLRVSLGLCPFSQVMQLTVWGRSNPAFSNAEGEPEPGYTVKERKYGEFKRVLVVPPETKVCMHPPYFFFEVKKTLKSEKMHSRKTSRHY